jgi:NADH-quinone oxidoreductase subunit D
MMSVVKLAIGHQLADVPMILVGIDPCFSCNDRMAAIDHGQGDPQVWTWEALRQYGIERYGRPGSARPQSLRAEP